MDLLEKSSILLTPTAYNNGEALCIKPDDASGDFDFSRNSAATRVNAQGLVENVQILSSNLVQNGDFSEEGVQEVSNGSFSQEGVELLSQPVNLVTDFSPNGGGVIVDADTFETSGGTYDGIRKENLFTVGKTYRLTIEGNTTSSGFNIGDTLASGNEYGSNFGTFYFTAVGSGSLWIRQNTSGVTNITTFSIVEVGQDWNLGTGWSIAEDKAVAVSGASSRLEQSINGLSGKTCKISFTLSDYGGGGAVYVDFGSVNSDLINTNGEHVVYGTFDQDEFELFKGSSFSGSITNISVKEVGMDWLFSGGAEITAQGARINNTITGVNAFVKQVNSNLTIGKSLVFQYDVVQTNGKDLAIEQIGGNISLNTSTIGNNRKVYFEFDRADASLIIKRAAAATDVTITNLSVIEITDDTNLPRINYEGFSYQDALGSEEIVNGDFSSDTAWVKGTGWSIGGGKATSDGTINSAIYQNAVTTIGKTYKYSFDILDSGVGVIDARFRNGFSGSVLNFSSEGTYTGTFVSYDTQANFTTLSGNTASFSIDNVSVKEYLGQEVVPNSGCGSWLFEPQSTNLITYSSDYNNSIWSKTGSASVTSNTTISPDGTQNADTLNIFSGNFFFQPVIGIGTFTLSCYVKVPSGTLDFKMQSFNSTDGANSSALFVATTEWQRFEHTVTVTVNSSFYPIQVSGLVGGDFEIWGAQVEANNISSYIPTEGSQVTRNQDLCTNGGSLATINSTEGTLYFEGAALSDDGTNRYISLNNGGTTDYLFFRYRSDNQFQVRYRSGNIDSLNTTFTLSNNLNFNKIAFSYKLNEFKIFVNGLQIGSTITSGSVFATTINSLDFEKFDGGQPFFGKTKAVAVWKEALSDQELTELTTI